MNYNNEPAGIGTGNTERNEKVTSIFDRMEESIQELRGSMNEEASKAAIEKFRTAYKEAKGIKSSMTEKQWAAVMVKVDIMKKSINKKTIQTMQILPSPTKDTTPIREKKPGDIPDMPKSPRPLIFLSSDCTKFAEDLSECRLLDDECIEMIDKFLSLYEKICTPVEMSEYRTIMCNMLIHRRHEDEWVFRWYGERNLNPKPTEWLHYLDAGMFLNPSYTSGDD